jgi:hypothetical protein
MKITDARAVVQVSTNIGEACKECGAGQFGMENFTTGVNHYLQAHDYTLLHVGTETGRDFEGHIWHSTVAVLGKK